MKSNPAIFDAIAGANRILFEGVTLADIADKGEMKAKTTASAKDATNFLLFFSMEHILPHLILFLYAI